MRKKNNSKLAHKKIIPFNKLPSNEIMLTCWSIGLTKEHFKSKLSSKYQCFSPFLGIKREIKKIGYTIILLIEKIVKMPRENCNRTYK